MHRSSLQRDNRAALLGCGCTDEVPLYDGSSAFVVLSHNEKALRTGMIRKSSYLVLLLCRKKGTTYHDSLLMELTVNDRWHLRGMWCR